MDRVDDRRRDPNHGDLAEAFDAERVQVLVFLGNEDDVHHTTCIGIHRNGYSARFAFGGADAHKSLMR